MQHSIRSVDRGNFDAQVKLEIGRERPQNFFGRLKAKKVGSLPPDLVFLARGTFMVSGSLKAFAGE